MDHYSRAAHERSAGPGARIKAHSGDQKEGLDAKDSHGLTSLHLAAIQSKRDVIDSLLSLGADVNATTENRWTVLHICGQYGGRQIAESFLDKGADVSAVDKDGWTALHVCASFGRTEEARLFLQRRAPVNARNMDRWTPLHISAEKGSTEVARVLLDYGADTNASGKDSWRPLHFCAQADSTEVALALLEKNADMELPNNEIQTPLHTCAYNNATGVAKILLSRGANTEAADENDWTPLHSCSAKGSREIADMLLEHGANKDAKDKDWQTPLHLCAKYNTANVARSLIARNANTVVRNTDQCTPLHLCARFGSIDVARALLMEGVEVDIDAGDSEQSTALHLCANYGSASVALALLERGVNVNAFDDIGRTPLHVAAEKGHVEIVRVLLVRGARPELQDGELDTALHLATENGHQDVVIEILKVNPERILNIAGTMGHTPLHIAVITDNIILAQILMGAGASNSSKDHRGMTPCDYIKDNQEDMRILLMLSPERVRMDVETSQPDKQVELHEGYSPAPIFRSIRETWNPYTGYLRNVELVPSICWEVPVKVNAWGKQMMLSGGADRDGVSSSGFVDTRLPSTEVSYHTWRRSDYSFGNRCGMLKNPEALKQNDFFADKYIIKAGTATEIEADIVPGKQHVCLARRIYDPKNLVVLKFYWDEAEFKRVQSFYSDIHQSVHVTKMLECIEAEKTGFPPCIVFEKGTCTLEEWISAERSLDEKKWCLHQVLTALKELHCRDYVHLHLKPTSIVFFSNLRSWKLTNWEGLQKAGEGRVNTTSVSQYAAPEIIKLDKEEGKLPLAHPALDLWAVGIIAYETLLGRKFFSNDTPRHDNLNRLQESRLTEKLVSAGHFDESRLLSKFLALDSRERWSAAEALQHSFFSSVETERWAASSFGSEEASSERHSPVDVFLDEVHVDDSNPRAQI